VIRHGQEIAVLVHAPEGLHRPHLVRAVLGAASLTIELARLQVELRRQLAEVEVSRARLLRAGDEERRRLERDLHDGAQQRLVGLGIRLRRIQRSLPGSARVLVPVLDEAVTEVSHAIADLRTIAAGLRPSSLDDGLAAALSELARSTPIPVDVAATRERLPEPIEAAAYFVACEAVTNAVKHGSPSSIRIDAARHDGAVHVVVADDGVGGAVARPGSGLAGLADRLGAHGGTLVVDSPPGTGTRVEAVIPCAS
jgi:signal transduction histidine kinase